MHLLRKIFVLCLALAAALSAACGDRGADAGDVTPALGTIRQGLAPANQMPPPQTTNEDSPLKFSSFGGNAITVSDADSTILTVQINVTNGTFVPKTDPDVTITGSGTHSVILSGPVGGINAALDGSVYRPAANYFGPAQLQMNSSDSDGNATLDTLDITVTSFNDPPVNNVPSGSQAATEDVPRAFNLPIIDVDVGASEMLVTLSSSNGTVITLPPATISQLTFVTGTGSAESTMTFTGTLPNVNAALNGLTITPPLNYIGTSTLVITSDDQGASGAGKPGSDSDTVTIVWAAVNDAPVNSVPGVQSTVEETPLTFSTTNGNALSLSDVDAPTALLQVTLDVHGGTLTLGSVSGLTFSAGDGTGDASMTFSGTLSSLNSALNGTVFTPNPDFAGAARITMLSNDLGNSGAGGAKQDSDAVTINVAGVNDAPRNSVPSAQLTNEDVARAFSTANGNAITVSDVDAPTLQVSLSAESGTLTLGGKQGLSFQSGDGTSDVSMTFTGTSAALNTALNGLTFTPTPHHYGSASVTVLTSDLGATGSGGTRTQQDVVAITVASVNDAPDAVNDSVVLAEDSGATSISVLANDTFAPDVGETLSITGTGSASNGTVTWTASSITYTPNANFNGTDSFSYTVSDGSGASDTATVTVNVSSVNDAPTAVDDSITVLQNSGPTSVGVLSNDSAAPDLGEVLTITSVTQPASGAVSITGSGTGLTYTPAADFVGEDPFTYTISDGHGGTATSTVMVAVAAVYTTPVNTLPAPQQTIEDTQLTFSSAAGNALSVADANNTELTVQVSVTNGTFKLGANTGLTVTNDGTATVTAVGSITSLNNGLNNARYMPAANYNGPATLTLRTNDSSGESDLDTLTLTVTAINDAPVNTVPTTAQAATEDVPKTFTSILVSDVDVGASEMLVTLTADNDTRVSLATTSGLAFTNGDGVGDATMTFKGTRTAINTALNGLTVTPPTNFIGTSTLTLVTNDQGGTGDGSPGQDTDVITLNWAANNDPPVNSVPGAQAMFEEGLLTFSAASGTGLGVSDVDISAGLIRVTLSATNGRVTLGNPSGVTFTAGTGFSETTMTFEGTLADVNTALDGSSFVPNVNFVGTATVTLTSNDLGNTGGAAKSDSDSISITVAGVNDAPVNTVPNTQFISEDGTLPFSSASGNAITVADVDATTLQVTLSAANGTLALGTKTNLTFQAGNGSAAPSMTFTGTLSALNGALNTLKFTPTPNFEGPTSITILTRDLGASGVGGALWDEDTLTVNVVPVNDNPTAGNDTVTVGEDAAPTTVAVLTNDSTAPDSGETLSITTVSVPAHGTASTDGAQVVYQPAANYFGTDSFTYTVSDGNGGVATATVAVTVTSINDPPDAFADSLTVVENSAATAVPVLANDTTAPDTQETLKITGVSTPAHGTVTITNNGAGLTYTPETGYSGPDLFTYTVSDGNGGTDSAEVTVTVTPFDYKPAAVADALTVPEDGSGSVAVLENDKDLGNAPLTVAISTPPANGTAVVQGDNTVLYTPTADYAGPDSFQYTVTDSNGDVATGTVTVTVTQVNDVPTAAADSATTTEDVSVKVAVQANDTGLVDRPVVLAVSTPPAHGTTTVEVDGAITYQPEANFVGTDTFQYTVTDANAEKSTAAVTVTVTAVNDAPVATPDSASTRPGSTVDIDVLANDVEVDGDPLTLTRVGAPLHGTATLTADARVRYVPAAGFSGTDQFEYTVEDGTGLSATATVVVGVGIDTDGDGLTDMDESELGTDPKVADTDQDLLSDGVEVNATKTDPLDGDTDDDGLLDGNEDSNKDGVLGASETGPTNADTDGDGLKDGTELGLAVAQGPGTRAEGFVADLDPTTRTDPRKADTDNGGLSDGAEDANHNGRVDPGETDPNQARDDRPAAPDGDRDGIPDANDNCPTSANTTQADADKDGVGDACEPPAEKPTGSGCSAGGTGGRGVSACLLGLVLVAMAVRRRRHRVSV